MTILLGFLKTLISQLAKPISSYAKVFTRSACCAYNFRNNNNNKLRVVCKTLRFAPAPWVMQGRQQLHRQLNLGNVPMPRPLLGGGRERERETLHCLLRRVGCIERICRARFAFLSISFDCISWFSSYIFTFPFNWCFLCWFSFHLFFLFLLHLHHFAICFTFPLTTCCNCATVQFQTRFDATRVDVGVSLWLPVSPWGLGAVEQNVQNFDFIWQMAKP